MAKFRKVFGMSGILDIIIIFFALALILPMLHYYMKFNEKGAAEKMSLESYRKLQLRNVVGFYGGNRICAMDVNVSFKNLTKEGLNKIRVHDKEVLQDGTVIAEILWLGKPEPNYFIADLGLGVFSRIAPDDSLYSVPAKLRLRGIQTNGGIFKYNSKDVKQLEFYTFTANDHRVDFVIEAPSFKSEEAEAVR